MSLLLAFDQFDQVTVGVFDKSNDGRGAFHWTRGTYHVSALGADFIAGLVGILDTNGNMPISVAKVIAVCFPVVGEFEYCVFFFTAITKKSQGEFTLGEFLFSHQFHAKYIGVEIYGFIHISNA